MTGPAAIRRWLAVLLLLVLAGAMPAQAVQPDEVLADPALEERAREISKELRCLVCRNEAIDDSHAALARDLRLLVRERLVAGDSDAEVVSYVVDRYGEFVLLRPRFSWGNAALWLAPPILFFAGLGAAIVFLRGRRTAAADPLSREEEEEVARLLKE